MKVLRRFSPALATAWPVVACAAAGLVVLHLAVYAAFAPVGLAPDLCRFDCPWYLSIATSGYDLSPRPPFGQANWAFFPLFPLAIRGVSALAGRAAAEAGIAVAAFGFWAFAVLGWLYRSRTRPAASPWTWLLFLMSWPYSLYFSVPYSESPFAALATACLLGLASRRAWLASVASLLLTASRPTGVLLAAWVGVTRLLGGPGRGLQRLAQIAVAPLGLIAFMLFLWWRVGDPLAFAHIQVAWGHEASNPLSPVLAALRDVRHHPGPLYDVAWTVLGLAAACWLLAKRRAAEAWLCAATVLAALGSGVLWSMPRFVGANPAFLFAAADLLESLPNRYGRAVVLIGCAVVQAIVLAGWYRGATYLM